MILHGRVSCDLCGGSMGQLWNEAPIACDLLPAPDFRVCDDCWSASVPDSTVYRSDFDLGACGEAA